MATNGDIIKALYAAFGRGDVPAVLGAFDPQIRWSEAEGFLYEAGSPYVGPQAVAEGVFMRITSDVQDFAVHPGRYHDAGDTVVVEDRYKGTWKSTGTPVDAQFAHVWHLKGGKVVQFDQYTDTKQWAAAAGA